MLIRMLYDLHFFSNNSSTSLLAFCAIHKVPASDKITETLDVGVEGLRGVDLTVIV